MANSYLSRSVTGQNTQTYTFSCWVKRSTHISNANHYVFSHYADSNNRISLALSNDTFTIYAAESGNTVYQKTTNRLLRDTSAWYHIVTAVDTTQGTGSNRVRVYINGVEETSFSTDTVPSQNATTPAAATHYVGSYTNSSNFLDGYMSHVAFVDGQQLTPTSFGETDSTSGIWKFKSPSGLSWGTNGFHLKFENSGALGTDSSGQGNTFAVNGNLKQSLDTPTNNHCTINFNNNINGGLHEYGAQVLDGLGGSPYDVASSGTLGFNQGKWYWEWKWRLIGSGNQAAFVGIIDADIPIVQGGNPSKGVTYRPDAGSVRKDGSEVSSAYSGSANDIFGMAFDMDAGTLKLHKNGTYFNSGNAVVTGIDLTKTYLPYIAPNGGTTVSNIDMNWGDGFFGITPITSAGSNGNGSLFEYDVPSGYYALNTKNINTYG